MYHVAWALQAERQVEGNHHTPWRRRRNTREQHKAPKARDFNLANKSNAIPNSAYNIDIPEMASMAEYSGFVKVVKADVQVGGPFVTL